MHINDNLSQPKVRGNKGTGNHSAAHPTAAGSVGAGMSSNSAYGGRVKKSGGRGK